MRFSWASPAGLFFAFVALVALGCGVFRLYPRHWSPATAHGILAGMAMYFVAYTGAVSRNRPRDLGRIGVGILYRAAAFLAILTVLAFVYFDRLWFFDITWPVLILAAWCLAESMLNSGRRGGVPT